MTATRDLKKIIANCQLPALPQSAIRILELSQDPDNGPPEYAVPIEADPGLTGQVLRFVNSSYFGFSREISSVRLAITLVGVRTIKNFALWSAVFSLMPNPKCGPFDLKSLWIDSLRRGLFARAMGRQVGLKESEDMFAAALLQDMAVPLLAREMPTQYEEMLEGREAGRVRLSELEKDRFGWHHAEAAALMARNWRLPEEFASLIETHVDLDELIRAPAPDRSRLTVGLSALLPSAHDPAWNERAKLDEMYRMIRSPDAPDLIDLLQRIDEEFDEFAPLLKLGSPTRTLVSSFQEEQTACV